MRIDLSIVVPFHNEEDNIESVLKKLSYELKKSKINYEIIAVDNASLDDTSKIIKNLSRVNKDIKYLYVKEKGYGNAVLNGLKKCSGNFIGYIDGDLEVLPSDLIKVYKKIKLENADLCKGLRDVRSSRDLRKIASIFYDVIFFLLYGKLIKQLNAKPKIMKKKIFDKLNLESRDWFIDAEIMIKALKNKYNIVYEKTTYNSKSKASSNIRFSTIFEFLKNLVKYRFKRSCINKHHQIF